MCCECQVVAHFDQSSRGYPQRSKSGANPAVKAFYAAALYPVVAASHHAPMVGPYASVDGACAGKSSRWGLRDALLSSWYQESYTIL